WRSTLIGGSRRPHAIVNGRRFVSNASVSTHRLNSNPYLGVCCPPLSPRPENSMARPEAKLKELRPAELKREIGARRDLVVTVNRRSESRLIAYGDDFMFEKLPVGTRVIYPPPPLEPLADPDVAIRYALLHPENADPLFAQLNPNMRVTIAI